MSRITKVLLCIVLAALLMGCASQPEATIDTSLYADGYQDGFAAGRAAALEELASQVPSPTPTPTKASATMQTGYPTFTPKPTNKPKDLTEIAINHWKSVTVYIANAGNEYHCGDCELVQDSRIAITLYDVIEHEYKPCDLCNPPLPYEPYP